MFGSVGAVVRNPARWGPYPAAQSLMTRADERRRELLKKYGINSRLLRALAGMSMPTLRHALEQLGPAFDGDKGFAWVEEAGYFGGGRTDGWLTARKGSGGLKLQRLLGSDECRALLRQMVLSLPNFGSRQLLSAWRHEITKTKHPVAIRRSPDVQLTTFKSFLGAIAKPRPKHPTFALNDVQMLGRYAYSCQVLSNPITNTDAKTCRADQEECGLRRVRLRLV